MPTRRIRRPRDGRRPLRRSPHDLGDRQGRRRRHEHAVAGARSRPRRRLLPAGGGRLLKAGENIVSNSIHLHSNGRDTTAHLEIGFKFLPKGYKPTLKPSQSRGLGNGARHLDPAERSQSAAARVHGAAGEHQGHVVRAAPARAGLAHVPRSDLGLSTSRRCRAPATTTTGCAATTTPTMWRRCCRRARSSTSSATWTTRRRIGTCPTRATGRARATGRSRTCSSTSGRAWRSATSSSRRR